MELRADGAAVAAPAKINATLDVLGRRPDGYHELRSVVLPLALHDDVSVSLAGDPGISVEIVPDGVDCSKIGPPEDNLCAKAARAFFRRFGAGAGDPSLAIRVVKRIPLGGGMGGGSADAAAVLRALAALVPRRGWSESIPLSSLAETGAEVGSDVPALVFGGAVLMEGRGERVSRAAGFDRPVDLLLANPGTHVSTAAVFRALDAAGIPRERRRSPSRLFGAALSNDLEEVVFGLYPEVADVAARLKRAGAEDVLMTGSGATVFATAESPAAAAALAAALPAGCWRAVTRTAPAQVAE